MVSLALHAPPPADPGICIVPALLSGWLPEMQRRYAWMCPLFHLADFLLC